MEWNTWVLLLTVIMEPVGSAFFFDTFPGRGKTEKGAVYQYRYLAYLGMSFLLTVRWWSFEADGHSVQKIVSWCNPGLESGGVCRLIL